MERKRRRVGFAALVISSLAFASSALAGHRISDSVYIYRSADGVHVHASGSLTDALNGTSDSLQYIGCTVSVSSSSEGVSCSARNSAGISVSCYSTNPRMIDAVVGANSYSQLSFNGTSGTCTGISVRNQSSYGP